MGEWGAEIDYVQDSRTGTFALFITPHDREEKMKNERVSKTKQCKRRRKSHLQQGKEKKMSYFQSFLHLLLLLIAMEGWAFTPATTAQPMRIGVPVNSPSPKYVRVKCNQTSNKCFDGFSIRLFELILKRLRYNKPYQLIPYNGSYDSLVQQVFLKVNMCCPVNLHNACHVGGK